MDCPHPPTSRVVVSGKSREGHLHTTSETQDEMESGLLLDIVIGKSSAVFKLLSGENQSLLVRRDTLLVLDLGLDIVDGIARFDFKGNGFAGEGFDEDLHTASETEDEVKGRLLLNVCNDVSKWYVPPLRCQLTVVGESPAIFKLLTSKDQSLLVRRDTLLVLDLGLDIVDGVGRLHFKSDSLTGESLDENLHGVWVCAALCVWMDEASWWRCGGR